MKLLKIGSSANCDIVINSDYVSGHHADLILLDGGEILIQDKGSRNGTFVGPNRHRLQPGEERPVRRGDLIRLGDTDLVWSRVPASENNSAYKQVVNIGSNFRNDVVVTDGNVSRFHAAVKIDRNNKAFIVDNGSTNGTQINGIRITPGRLTRIKKGDNIVVGEADITSQLEQYIPSRFGWLKAVGGVAACAALIAAIILILPLFSTKNYRDSVVYVMHNYSYIVTLKNNPLNVNLKIKVGDVTIQGTAFFIDKDGHMGTARHVAVPWLQEYDHDRMSQVKQILYISVPGGHVSSMEEVHFYIKKSEIFDQIASQTQNLAELNSVIDAINSGAIEISGATNYMLIGYAGRNYTTLDEFDRASLTAESGSIDKDVAILQLNSKKTPEKIEHFLEIEDAYTGVFVPMKEDLTTIGYPSGLWRSLDFKSKTMEPTIRQSKISKVPNRYTFELQDHTVGGASGSPVFFNNGSLAGIMSMSIGATENAATSAVCDAKYLLELYNAEVK